jgi:CRISPR/Cas system CSM-associated protein Csm4 (group 5 of RAMP superfamily)
LFNPDRQEIEDGLLDSSAYDFTGRGGWIAASCLKKPPLKMFMEGSVFSRKPEGRTVQVLSPGRFGSFVLKRPVFRHGRAFSASMRSEP